MAYFPGFNTRAVHSGEFMIPEIGNVTTPIFQTATFEHPNRSRNPTIDRPRNAPFLYSRLGNPTVQALEEKYASLEGSDFSLAFPSGMAAISSSILAMNNAGSSMLSVQELYGETYGFLSSGVRKYGMGTEFIGVDSLNSLEFDPSEKSLVYLESIINPTMKVADIAGISRICKENNVPLVVDATFASPLNQKPLRLGASLVMHSGTKYISGHSDMMLGLIGTSDSGIFKSIYDMRKSLGPSVDPMQAFLGARGMKTLGLRVERQNRVAMEVANYLEQHREVQHVLYPGLESSPYRQIAERNLEGFGGMLSFELKGGIEAARKLMKHLQIPRIAASLGGVESLVSLPVETSHADVPAGKRSEMGISNGLIRFSCGIEDPEDVIADLEKGLSAV